MINKRKTQAIANTQGVDSVTFSVMCGVPGVARTLVSNLEWQGVRYDAAALITILLDTPRGFAPHILEKLGKPGTSSRRLIIGTWSYCREYWEDLWGVH